MTKPPDYTFMRATCPVCKVTVTVCTREWDKFGDKTWAVDLFLATHGPGLNGEDVCPGSGQPDPRPRKERK